MLSLNLATAQYLRSSLKLGESPKESEGTSERFTANEDSVDQDTLKSVNSQEGNSLVGSSRSERASGNRL